MESKINIDESAARIAAQLENNPSPIASTTTDPAPTKNLDGTETDEAKAKADEAEAARVAAEASKQAELDASNKAAAEAKAVEDKAKEIVAAKEAGVENLEDENLDELSEEDLNYLKEIEGEKVEAAKEGKEGKEVKEEKDTKKVEAKKEVDDIAPIKAKASEYEKLMSDPLLKAFADFRKEGGQDLAEFQDKIGISDISKLTPEQLHEQRLNGLNLSDEDKAEDMDRFKSLTKAQQAIETQDIKNKLLQERDEKLKTFSATVNKEAEAYKVFEQQAISKGVTELGDTLSKMEGKKYKGLTVTPEMVNEIRQYVTQNTVPKFGENNEFIGYDIERSIHNAMHINYGTDMIKVAAKMAKAHGMHTALKLRQRTNKNETVTNQVPISTKDIKDHAKDAGNEQWRARGYKS